MRCNLKGFPLTYVYNIFHYELTKAFPYVIVYQGIGPSGICIIMFSSRDFPLWYASSRDFPLWYLHQGIFPYGMLHQGIFPLQTYFIMTSSSVSLDSRLSGSLQSNSPPFRTQLVLTYSEWVVKGFHLGQHT